MGVSDVLPKILESSGRPIDLRDIPSFKRKRLGSISRNAGGGAGAGNQATMEEGPLRIGIDVHSWIYTAGHAFSDRLGDERHLTNYGRASLYEQQQLQQQPLRRFREPSEEALKEYVGSCVHYVMKRLKIVQQTTGAELLVVLDGRSPPIKAQEVAKRRQLSQAHNAVRQDPTVALGSPSTVQAANQRRMTSNRRAGPGKHIARILEELVDALRAASRHAYTAQEALAFMVAPYEADAQLAYLARQHYIDLIITEDSDLMAHGAPCILYKSLRHIADGAPAGVLWQFQDLGAMPLGGRPAEGQRSGPVIPVTTTGKNFIQLMDFTPVMMAIMFVLLGCDYTGGETKKLKGIGLMTAHQIVRAAFLGDGKQKADNSAAANEPSVLSVVLENAYKLSYDQKKLTRRYKREYEHAFMDALFMYRHPVVFDPVLKDFVLVNRRFSEFPSSSSSGNLIDKYYKNLGDPELLQHPAYAKLCRDRLRIVGIVGEIPPTDDAIGIVEGEINWRAKKPTPLPALADTLGVPAQPTTTPPTPRARDGNQVTEPGQGTAERRRKRDRAPSSDKAKRPRRVTKRWSDRDDEELERKIMAVGFGLSEDDDSTGSVSQKPDHTSDKNSSLEAAGSAIDEVDSDSVDDRVEGDERAEDNNAATFNDPANEKEVDGPSNKDEEEDPLVATLGLDNAE
ncbi:MAG: hypothetical protein SGILL_010014, partial [Bacillariaceae sp.]